MSTGSIEGITPIMIGSDASATHHMEIPQSSNLCSRRIVYAPDDAESTYDIPVTGGFEFCKICYTNRKDTQFDCGHLLCQSCADIILSKNRSTCPFCRTQVYDCQSVQIAGKILQKDYGDQPWCAAGIERQQLWRDLRSMRVGSFFVRESSSQPDTYSIDVLVEGGCVRSFRVFHKAAGWRFELGPFNNVKGYYDSIEDCLDMLRAPGLVPLLPEGIKYPGGMGN